MGYFLSAGYAEIYEDFLAWQKPRITAKTYYVRRSHSYRILKWFEKENIPLKEATIEDIILYKEALSGQVTEKGIPFTAGTINQYLNLTKLLFQYLVLSGERISNPMQEIDFIQHPFRLNRNYLNEPQMYRLLGKLAQFDEATSMAGKRRRYRAHVIAETLYATGLRQHELALVEEDHINIAEKTIYIPCGKGGQSRTAFLTKYASDILELYLNKGRPAAMPSYLVKEHPERVFGSWLADTIQTELRIVCKEINIPIITCHGFRHSLGTHLMKAGCDIRHIQAILGHQSISSTTVYTHVDKDDLKKSLDEYHPRQWSKKEEIKP